jgi:uncharacterized protein (DUF2225 family)
LVSELISWLPRNARDTVEVDNPRAFAISLMVIASYMLAYISYRFISKNSTASNLKIGHFFQFKPF